MRRELRTQELLRDLVVTRCRGGIREIRVNDVAVRSDLEPEDRAVADRVQEAIALGIYPAQGLGAEQVVVADDPECAGQFDERIEIVHHHEVEVEE